MISFYQSLICDRFSININLLMIASKDDSFYDINIQDSNGCTYCIQERKMNSIPSPTTRSAFIRLYTQYELVLTNNLSAAHWDLLPPSNNSLILASTSSTLYFEYRSRSHRASPPCRSRDTKLRYAGRTASAMPPRSSARICSSTATQLPCVLHMSSR